MAKCFYTAIKSEPGRNGMVLQPVCLESPNAKCAVCSDAGATVTLDVHKTSLATFVSTIVKTKLGFSQPEFDVGSDINRVWMYPDDYEDDGGSETFDHIMIDQLPGSGGIQDGSVLKISDDIQGITIDVKVQHQNQEDFDKEKFPEYYHLKFSSKHKPGDTEKKSGEGGGKEDASGGADDAMDIDEEDDDDCVMIVEDPALVTEKKTSGASGGGGGEESHSGEPAQKKARKN